MEGKKFVTFIEMETNDEVTCQQIFFKKFAASIPIEYIIMNIKYIYIY